MAINTRRVKQFAVLALGKRVVHKRVIIFFCRCLKQLIQKILCHQCTRKLFHKKIIKNSHAPVRNSGHHIHTICEHKTDGAERIRKCQLHKNVNDGESGEKPFVLTNLTRLKCSKHETFTDAVQREQQNVEAVDAQQAGA